MTLAMVVQQAASPVRQRRTLVTTTDLDNKRILTSMYLPTVVPCKPRPRSPCCRTFRREIRSNLRAHNPPIVRTTLSNDCRFPVTNGRCTRVCAPNEWVPYGRESAKCCNVYCMHNLIFFPIFNVRLCDEQANIDRIPVHTPHMLHHHYHPQPLSALVPFGFAPMRYVSRADASVQRLLSCPVATK